MIQTVLDNENFSTPSNIMRATLTLIYVLYVLTQILISEIRNIIGVYCHTLRNIHRLLSHIPLAFLHNFCMALTYAPFLNNKDWLWTALWYCYLFSTNRLYTIFWRMSSTSRIYYPLLRILAFWTYLLHESEQYDEPWKSLQVPSWQTAVFVVSYF